MRMAGQTLFEKYGGFSRISKVVLSFYDSLLDSETIGPFFDDIDMARMVDHQTKFVASLLGGPAAYTDSQLQRLHAQLAITDLHFDELKAVLRGTLRSHNFEQVDVEAVLEEFEKRRRLIVG
jgi:hemoglobin